MGGSTKEATRLESQGNLKSCYRQINRSRDFQAKLKSLHEVVVRNRLEQLRKRQRDEALQAQEELLAGVAQSAVRGMADARVVVSANAQGEPEVSAERIEPYDRSMSPSLIDITRLRPDEREFDIVTERNEMRALVGQLQHDELFFSDASIQLEQRHAVAASSYVPKASQAVPQVEEPEVASGADVVSEALYRAEAERELDEEEELFNLEEDIAQPTSYNWEDKYRPRKPRYFNRVHTGYEWNKYNQTHYEYVFLLSVTSLLYTNFSSHSVDNPPPKVVQGYKACTSSLHDTRALMSLFSSTFSIRT